MLRTTLVVLPLLFWSLCGHAQSIVKTIMHDGIQRDYRVYVPAIYDGNESVPLVFNLHGYTSNASQQEVFGDFRPIADTANFILVHPNGTLDQTGTTFWNSLGSTTETVDDVGFIAALIDTLAADYNIDLQRVYSTGMSNGGFMSYKLACELTDRIAAIACVAGSMSSLDFNACNPSEPTPVMHIHGTQDGISFDTTQGQYVAVNDVLSEWVSKNNCDTVPSIVAVPDIDTTDGCTAEQWVYTGGDEGTTIELFKVIGGEHSWPGTDPFFAQFVGVTNQDFSASVEIWRFFSKYSQNGLLVGVTEEDQQEQCLLYPNPVSDILTVKSHEPIEKLTVLDLAGNSVLEVDGHKKRQVEIAMESLNSGLYVLIVSHSSSQQVLRFLKN